MNTTPRRKFWGWGFEGQGLDEDEAQRLRERVARGFGVDELSGPPPPPIDEVPLRSPRIQPPPSLAHLCTADPYERLLHSYGRSFADAVRIFRRDFPEPPDQVAYPKTEDDVTSLLSWIDGAGAAAIPFGGGSSVCGGVEPAVGDNYRGTVSLDLAALTGVVEVDATSRAASIRAGTRGPVLEAELKSHGLTLRHFPQSFEHSTLGGWIATRSGGHFASLFTHIDDFVESLRVVTPRGTLESRRLPGSGAGPSPDRLFIGSEGILGVITQAWVRLQSVPKFRASAAALFSDFFAGSEAVRALSQAGLYPSNCRLIDAREAAVSGAADGSHALLVLGFESGDHPVEPWMARALELVADAGGEVQLPEGGDGHAGDPHRTGAAGEWRRAFLRAPYAREVLAPTGVIGDTFETAVTWDRFHDLYEGVMARMGEVIREVTGKPGHLSCRFTHVYPDGPAPYFTFQGLGTLAGALEQWREIKEEANQLVVALGGTVTHHHAVGRDHRSGYRRQRPALFADALAAAKHALDPNAILNPGVLIDPIGRPLGVTGAMKGAVSRDPESEPPRVDELGGVRQ